MATFVLLPGAGSDSWYWHLVVPDLEVAGHDVVAVDLPVTDDTAGFTEYADVVVDAIGDRRDVVLVAQSLAGFTAPLVCERVPVELMILVAAMVPRPGESAASGGRTRAHAEARGPDASDDPVEMFLHDVPDDVARESEHHVFAAVGCSRSRRRGRSTRGPTCRPASFCAATTDSSRPSSSDGWCGNASASSPTRWTVAISRR